MKKLLTGLLSVAFVAMWHGAYASGCDGLPPASHDTVYESAQDYATGGEQSLDENGIVLFDYKSEYNNLGKWPNPFFNAQYAHALYRDWLNTGCTDDGLKSKFLHHAEWLKKIHTEKNGMALWTYPFYNRFFNVDAGWYSGIGQATIAGVLFRAYSVSKDRQFQELGQKALEVYFHPVSEGGVMTADENGPWIQEVPDPKSKPSNILNGHITGIFSLIDVSGLSGEKERIDALVRQSIATVKHAVPLYDAGFTTFYSEHMQDGKYAQIGERRGYNTLHVTQMLQLYRLDGDPLFLDWAMRFQFYDDADDTRNAKGSTDPVGHGPNEAAGWYGIRYWSHNQFPTWYDVSFNSTTLLDGVYLEGLDDVAMAKDFTISTYLNGERREHVKIAGNQKRQIYFRFKDPIPADKVRIDIRSDNGNHNVAMVAIMPIRHNIGKSPVADACNHRTDGGSYLLWRAFDENPGTAFPIHCDGFIVLPKHQIAGKLTIGAADGDQPISIKISDDLKDWRKLGEIAPHQSDRRTIDIPANVYTKIDLKTDLVRIDGIKYEGLLPPGLAKEEPFFPGIRSKVQ